MNGAPKRAAMLALSIFMLAAAAPRAGERRLTLGEARTLPVVPAGAGTSKVNGIETRLLHGDPTKPGLYTISIRVPPNTRIAAHTHRDDRTAVVAAGIWHFGYGSTASQAASRSLPAASFYTEPAGEPHFAWTGSEGATVYISGQGPTDTLYVNSADDPSRR